MKFVNNATYQSVVRAEDEKVVIDGYNYDSAEPEVMTSRTRQCR